ncbi:DUF4307 domain-containing protein [Planosporangium mesophilum]|uniref:DUF4307 domain-containing protein n=1 Tax=Planosporangium mesophilum TaxID=689768 RepID=UPI00143AC9A9|nr:DUF4307 domain-containing protein [Planosporangium mesophilum]NJC84875.1 DUF4307 domain-containing protein [Planosporangium mesophilum]
MISDASIFPAGRYGRRRERRPARRGVTTFFMVAGAVVGLVLAMTLYQRYGTPDYRPQVVHFQLGPDHTTLRFEVHKAKEGPATCHVRARNRAGAEVGAADVPLPAGNPVTVTYTLKTSGPPVSAEVPACRAVSQ